MIDLEFKESESEQEWFIKEFKNSLVDLTKRPERPETVISIGTYNWNGKIYDNPVMTAGEMSAISAPSKSYKTYFVTHLASAFIKSSNCEYLNMIKGHRQQNDALICNDTEQGKYNAWWTFYRVKQMSGLDDIPFFYPFKLRHLSPKKRVTFIDNIIKSDITGYKPKLIFIDGVADLIEDTNDLVMSNEISEKIMTWTDVYNCHVCVVIHNAFNTVKPTGHLGSAIIKKAESVINLKPEIDENGKKTGIVNVNHQYSRKAPFEDFKFRKAVNADHLEIVDEDNIF